MHKVPCAHCGLPVVTRDRDPAGSLFCCYGCYLAQRIVGGGDGESLAAWGLLRFGIGAFFAMNVMMVSLLLYTRTAEAGATVFFRWALLGLSLPAMALVAVPFAVGAIGEISRRQLRFDALIAVGSFGAFFVSAANTLRGQGHIYYDTACLLPLLVTFGKLLEGTAKSRAGRMVRTLETLLPKNALRIEADGSWEIPLSRIRIGDRLLVHPGQRFPADGEIVEGRTVLDQGAFTGEFNPCDAGPGQAVLAGSINGQNPVTILVRAVGEDLLLRRIIEIAEQARMQPSRLERLADRAAAWFLPIVLLLAAGSGTWWFFHAGPVRAGSVALSVLVVACPCAMGIAAPLALALAVGRAARRGIVVRRGDVFELLDRVDTVFFDKTGTLTAGVASIAKVETFDSALSENELLAWLASLETAVDHAIARAVVSQAKAKKLVLGTVTDVETFPGLGLAGTVTLGQTSRRICVRSGPALGPEHDPQIVIDVLWDQIVRGRVFLEDAIRPEAAGAVKALRDRKVTTVLLSGDRIETARFLAEQLKFDRVEAPRRPEEKAHLIHTAVEAGKVVAMVGDGVNDAPALAAAHVGIALGAGTDLARQAGHVVLLSNRLDRIVWLMDLGRRTRKVVVQNLVWAFAYNAIALTAAAMGLLHPLLAAVVMVFSSITVLANSLRNK